MVRKRYTVEQIIAAVKQHERGTPVPELCRKLGIPEATFSRWKQQCGGLEASEVRDLKQMSEQNAMLKKLMANLSLVNAMLQEIAGNKR